MFFKNDSIYKEKYFLLFILILIFLIYSPVLSFGFLFNSDDSWMLVNNSEIWLDSYDFIFFKKIFTQFRSGQYSPINTLLYKVTYDLFGLNPQIYHLSSIIFHYINCVLLYFFLKKNKDIIWAEIKNIPLDKICCLVFATHPANVETIAWIACTKILLCSTFILLSLIYFSKAIRYDKYFYVIFSLIFFLIAFGFKEQAVIVPLLVLCLLFPRHIKKYFYFFILFLFFSSIGIIWTIYGINQTFFLHISISYKSLLERFSLIIYSLIMYINNLLIPNSLFIKYKINNNLFTTIFNNLKFFSIIFTTTLYILYYNKTKLTNSIIFGFLFFFLNILPYIHIIPLPRFSILADRYLYLSSIGFFILIISILNLFFKSRYINFSMYIYIVYCILLANIRCRYWESFFI